MWAIGTAIAAANAAPRVIAVVYSPVSSAIRW